MCGARCEGPWRWWHIDSETVGGGVVRAVRDVADGARTIARAIV